MPKVMLLDAGNTLVFLDHEVVASIARTHGVDVKATTLAKVESIAKRNYAAQLRSGLPHESAWGEYFICQLGAAGVEDQAARSVVPHLRAEHDRFNLWRHVPDDLHAALARVRDVGARMGVVSNSEGKLDALFARLDLAQYFEIVVDSAIEGVSKPDPEIFRRAMARLSVSASDCVYLGDIPDVDAAGATAAGMPCVIVDAFDMFTEYKGAKVRSVGEYVTATSPATTRDARVKTTA